MARPSPSTATDTPAPIDRLLYPFHRFARIEASSGIVLLAATAAALLWANSSWRGSYTRLFETQITVGAGSFALSKTLVHWINDGLMSIFFFVAGLEIKREIMAGELRSPKRAALPVSAALGGMVAPAAIYAALNHGTPLARGWGIPMATDIAFAVGILALAGSRVPTSLKVFLTALAIVDDIGAVIVIAFFYSGSVALATLAGGAALLMLSVAASRAGVRSPLVYALIGACVWLAFLKSGVHATVAGVLLALTIPAARRMDTDAFVARGRAALACFENGPADSARDLESEREAAVIELEQACEAVQTPLQRMEWALHPWVSYVIMPAFALANAGVTLSGASASLASGAPIGVALGLVIGKPLGVTLFAWLAVRARLAEMPSDVRWAQLHGAGWLAGIGFTMSLFIGGLAFEHAAVLAGTKAAILASSVVAGVVGFAILRRAGS